MKISNILFIVNPITGKNRLNQFPEFVKRYLLDTIRYNIIHSEKVGHSKILAAEALQSQQYDVIVAVGGDGTVNEVGSQLINSKIKLGIIPNGSGNGLARELGIPLQMSRAIRLLNQSTTTTIDAGKVNGHFYFCTAGVGFDAHIGKLFAQSKTRGFRTYVQKVIGAYWSYHPAEYLIFNGKPEPHKEKAFAITIANARQYGNNAYIAPEAKINDGKLNLCIIKPFPRYKMLEIGSRLFMGNINRSLFYKSWPVETVKIENAQADCFHLDGEHFPLSDGKLQFEVISKALQVITP